MNSPLNPSRTVTHQGIVYQVTRLYSSGLGSQYAATFKTPEGKEQTIFMTDEIVDKTPAMAPLFAACAKRFDDSLTFAKYIGSSSFWQSQLPPDGITKKD